MYRYLNTFFHFTYFLLAGTWLANINFTFTNLKLRCYIQQVLLNIFVPLMSEKIFKKQNIKYFKKIFND